MDESQEEERRGEILFLPLSPPPCCFQAAGLFLFIFVCECVCSVLVYVLGCGRRAAAAVRCDRVGGTRLRCNGTQYPVGTGISSDQWLNGQKGGDRKALKKKENSTTKGILLLINPLEK